MASIRERKNKDGIVISYEIRVSRGRDSSGKQIKPYVMSWQPPEGWSTRSIKSELARVAGQFEAECKAGLILTKEEKQELECRQKKEAELQQQEDERKVTLKKYALETFIPRKEATFSENARDSYLKTLDRIFKYLGNIKMEEIRPLDITNFFIAMQTSEKVQRWTKSGTITTAEPLSYATIIKAYTVLHSLFKMAFLDDVIISNPLDRVERPKPRKDEKESEIKALNVEEARHLLKCLNKEPLQWQVIIRLMLDTGCRRGEICGLRWKYVDLKQNQITICNNLQYSKAKGVYDTTTKGGKSRTIDVDSDIVALLKNLKESQKVTSVKAYCFIGEDGHPINPQSPTRYLHNFGKRHGISDLHPHMLRHTAASIAITHGADIASVSAKLGHADKSTTLDMYTHADTESIKRANEVYRAALYKKEA